MSFEVLNAAFRAGINFIDTADIYSRWVDGNSGGVAETIIGSGCIISIFQASVVIATKVRGQMGEGPNDEGLSRAHILHAVEESLRRLNTDYIDLYQAHWFDEHTPIEETLSTLDDLVHQGKCAILGAQIFPHGVWYRLCGLLTGCT
jgi:aryl-alcohol dehydrogenase-like predicted oxidoreductase